MNTIYRKRIAEISVEIKVKIIVDNKFYWCKIGSIQSKREVNYETFA